MDLLRLAALWRGHRCWAFVVVGIRLAVSATWIVQAFASASILAAIVRPTPGLDWLDAIAPAALALAVSLALRPVLQILGQLAGHRAMSVVKRELRLRTLHALVLRSARDPRGRSGADHALVVDGVEHLDAYLAGYLPQLAVTVVVITVVGSVMVVVEPAAGIAAILVALAVPLAPRLWGRVLAARGGDQWAAYEALQAEFVDSMQGMTTLVAFGAEGRREQQLRASSSALLERTIAQLRFSLVDSGLAAFALAAAPAAVLIALALGSGGEATATVFLLVLLSIELVRPLRDLAALWHAGYVGTFSGRAILRLLDGAPSAATAGPRHEPHRIRSISVEGLVVRHPGSQLDALRVERLAFDRGMTAIVGPSGAGKSTFAAALVGLIDAECGEVSIDGVVTPPEQLLRSVSLVPQDPALFGGTVADEISRGDPTADAAVIARAAAESGIGTDDPRIGLGTPVGEGGALLSGGQRQRVAIARALVQARAVLVLDEATSALDPASEAGLIARLRRDRSRVLIAVTHRAAVAAVADRVVTIGAGGVVEPDHPVASPAEPGRTR